MHIKPFLVGAALAFLCIVQTAHAADSAATLLLQPDHSQDFNISVTGQVLDLAANKVTAQLNITNETGEERSLLGLTMGLIDQVGTVTEKDGIRTVSVYRDYVSALPDSLVIPAHSSLHLSKEYFLPKALPKSSYQVSTVLNDRGGRALASATGQSFMAGTVSRTQLTVVPKGYRLSNDAKNIGHSTIPLSDDSQVTLVGSMHNSGASALEPLVVIRLSAPGSEQPIAIQQSIVLPALLAGQTSEYVLPLELPRGRLTPVTVTVDFYQSALRNHVRTLVFLAKDPKTDIVITSLIHSIVNGSFRDVANLSASFASGSELIIPFSLQAVVTNSQGRTISTLRSALNDPTLGTGQYAAALQLPLLFHGDIKETVSVIDGNGNVLDSVSVNDTIPTPKDVYLLLGGLVVVVAILCAFGVARIRKYRLSRIIVPALIVIMASNLFPVVRVNAFSTNFYDGPATAIDVAFPSTRLTYTTSYTSGVVGLTFNSPRDTAVVDKNCDGTTPSQCPSYLKSLNFTYSGGESCSSPTSYSAALKLINPSYLSDTLNGTYNANGSGFLISTLTNDVNGDPINKNYTAYVCGVPGKASISYDTYTGQYVKCVYIHCVTYVQQDTFYQTSTSTYTIIGGNPPAGVAPITSLTTKTPSITVGSDLILDSLASGNTTLKLQEKDAFGNYLDIVPSVSPPSGTATTIVTPILGQHYYRSYACNAVPICVPSSDLPVVVNYALGGGGPTITPIADIKVFKGDHYMISISGSNIVTASISGKAVVIPAGTSTGSFTGQAIAGDLFTAGGTVGSHTLTLDVADGLGKTATSNFKVIVLPLPTVSLIGTSPASPIAGSVYQLSYISANAGVGKLTDDKNSPTVSIAQMVAIGGLIKPDGADNAAGTYTFTLVAQSVDKDSNNQYALAQSAPYSVSVAPAPILQTNASPVAIVANYFCQGD